MNIKYIASQKNQFKKLRFAACLPESMLIKQCCQQIPHITALHFLCSSHSLYFTLFFKIYCIFSITISPPYIPLPTAITTLLSMSMIPFTILLNPSTRHTTPRAVSLLSLGLSILLVSSVCLLDSIDEWNHMVLVFLWLAYFT